MRTLCDRCNREINTDGVLKGQKAFYYEIQHDTEPHINTACMSTKSGYICIDCSKKIMSVLDSRY